MSTTCRITDKDIEDFTHLVVTLIEENRQLEIAIDRLRWAAQEVAGCDIGDWTLEDLDSYVTLFLLEKWKYIPDESGIWAI